MTNINRLLQDADQIVSGIAAIDELPDISSLGELTPNTHPNYTSRRQRLDGIQDQVTWATLSMDVPEQRAAIARGLLTFAHHDDDSSFPTNISAHDLGHTLANAINMVEDSIREISNPEHTVIQTPSAFTIQRLDPVVIGNRATDRPVELISMRAAAHTENARVFSWLPLATDDASIEHGEVYFEQDIGNNLMYNPALAQHPLGAASGFQTRLFGDPFAIRDIWKFALGRQENPFKQVQPLRLNYVGKQATIEHARNLGGMQRHPEQQLSSLAVANSIDSSVTLEDAFIDYLFNIKPSRAEQFIKKWLPILMNNILELEKDQLDAVHPPLRHIKDNGPPTLPQPDLPVEFTIAKGYSLLLPLFHIDSAEKLEESLIDSHTTVYDKTLKQIKKKAGLSAGLIFEE